MKFLKKEQKDKIKKIYYKYTGKIKNKRLKVKDFTIISNNCFGGVFYRNNALEYNSPTCGLFMMADEYIKFIYNLDYYLSIDDIKEIKVEDSKYVEYLKKIKYNKVLGKIGDLEVGFLHYDTIEEAKEKWNRRKKRINKEKMIFKFNDQNWCNYSHLEAFDKFPAEHKICFTAKQYENLDTIQLKQFEGYEYVWSDVREKDYKKYFDMYKFINDSFSK